MDPQQRLLLEVSWEALEDAGHAPADIGGTRTGVYLGIANNDYGRALFAHPKLIEAYFSTGNAYSVAAGRLSYFLGVHGPSIAVDTACSSSLVALHLACQGLRLGECDLALAGGVNLILTPEMNINFSKARMMAPDGRCKTFDAAADGYVRGEGCAVVLLRRMADALSDGDRILAVIRGSAVNQDGRSGGLTAPNGPAQESVIRAALALADVPASAIGYIEAHGTGTPLGDPIEVGALGNVFGGGRDGGRPLMIGSVKTNIGHLEAAAGMAGLIKVVLGLQRREIPPSLHFHSGNPHIDWAALPIASADDGYAMGACGRAPAGRHQLIRVQRNKCSRNCRRGAERASRGDRCSRIVQCTCWRCRRVTTRRWSIWRGIISRGWRRKRLSLTSATLPTPVVLISDIALPRSGPPLAIYDRDSRLTPIQRQTRRWRSATVKVRHVLGLPSYSQGRVLSPQEWVVRCTRHRRRFVEC